MNNNNRKTKSYTQGQRLAARVLLIVWLCLGSSPQSALADYISLYKAIKVFGHLMLCISAGAPLKISEIEDDLKIPLRRVLEQDGTCPALKNCDLSERQQLGLSLTDSSLAHRSLLAPTSSNRSSD